MIPNHEITSDAYNEVDLVGAAQDVCLPLRYRPEYEAKCHDSANSFDCETYRNDVVNAA